VRGILIRPGNLPPHDSGNHRRNMGSRPVPLQADKALKQQALDRTTPPASAPSCYKPPDQLLAFLESL